MNTEGRFLSDLTYGRLDESTLNAFTPVPAGFVSDAWVNGATVDWMAWGRPIGGRTTSVPSERIFEAYGSLRNEDCFFLLDAYLNFLKTRVQCNIEQPSWHTANRQARSGTGVDGIKALWQTIPCSDILATCKIRTRPSADFVVFYRSSDTLMGKKSAVAWCSSTTTSAMNGGPSTGHGTRLIQHRLSISVLSGEDGSETTLTE